MDIFIKLPGGSAIITKNKGQCRDGKDHAFDTTILECKTFDDKTVLMSQHDYDLLGDSQKKLFNIVSSQSACVRCGIGYMQWDNPNYWEE